HICCCWRSKYVLSAPAPEPAQLLTGRGFGHINPHHQSQQGRRAGSLFHRRKHA
ncbi:unnamed protein product, partial [Ectocarpus sp. 12 AP-2014]